MKSGITKISLALLLLISIIGCNKEKKNCIQGPGTEPVCTADYQPVCGCNDVTYSNACQASSDGISDFTEGECP